MWFDFTILRFSQLKQFFAVLKLLKIPKIIILRRFENEKIAKTAENGDSMQFKKSTKMPQFLIVLKCGFDVMLI